VSKRSVSFKAHELKDERSHARNFSSIKYSSVYGTSGHDFPNLNRSNTCKQDGETTVYNCLAWCISDTTQWWWFQADANSDGKISKLEMTAFLSSKGVAAGSITYYGPSTNDVVHVAKNAGG
jgi:hypothetical protein